MANRSNIPPRPPTIGHEENDGPERISRVQEAGQSTPPNPEDLISRYQRRVYAVIYRMTGHHSEVDDLCQETLLQALRGLPRLQPGSNVDSWVYRIAMNVSVDYLRRKSKERKIVERLMTQFHVSRAAVPIRERRS